MHLRCCGSAISRFVKTVTLAMVGYSKENDSDRIIYCLPPHGSANCLNVYPKAMNLNKASSRIINEHHMQNKIWLTNLKFYVL